MMKQLIEKFPDVAKVHVSHKLFQPRHILMSVNYASEYVK